MPEAARHLTDLPAPFTGPHRGTAAGRQPEAAGHLTDLPAPFAPPGGAGDRDRDVAGLADRILAAAEGLAPLVAQAEAVRERRAQTHGWPRWTDVFTTQFTEFSNRPR